MGLSEEEADALLIQLAQRAGGIVPLLCCPPPTLEATQGQILSQSPTDATRFW